MAAPPARQPPAPTRPPSEQSAVVLDPAFHSAKQPLLSSPAEAKREIGRFTSEFRRLHPDRRDTAATEQLLKLFGDSVEQKQQESVVEVSAKRLVDGALAGMTQAQRHNSWVRNSLRPRLPACWVRSIPSPITSMKSLSAQ